MRTSGVVSLRRAAVAGVAALALVPAAASAGTLSYENDTLVLRAAPGEANSITLSGEEPGRLSVSDSATTSFPAQRCTQVDVGYSIHCDVPANVRLELADGDDRVVVAHTAPAGLRVLALGGEGEDELKAIDGQTTITFDGGAGDDLLRSEGGGDVLRGGAGADRLEGNGGADTLDGGEGDDTLGGDACGTPAPDVLDGGPGDDTLTDWGDCGPGTDRRPVTVTVNGVADDGRPGEGDDVRDVDHLQLFVPATVIGDDGAQRVEVFAPADRSGSTVQGRGGADDLRAGSGSETLDGGAGPDRIEGGFGDDTLTGGSGRDELHGDATSAQCGGNGQSCTYPFGNDTINARDGEVDTIDCGVGQDRVVADAADVVAADCETVERPGGQTPGGQTPGGQTPGGPPGGPGTAAPGRPRLTVTLAGRLRLTLDAGLVVRLAGFTAGPVTVAARVAGKVVAVGRVTVGPGGSATARVRFTRPARRAFAKRRVLRLTVRAGAVSKTITVRR